MRRRSPAIAASLLAAIFMFSVAGFTAQAEEYGILKGAKSVDAVFDFRAGNPETVAILLDMMLQTVKDLKTLEGVEEPSFSVVFIGPSVKLITTRGAEFFPEQKEALSKIANTVTEMSKAGVDLEICLAAAGLFGVDPATVLPEIKRVPNGLVSLIGYQEKGYSLVPVY